MIPIWLAILLMITPLTIGYVLGVRKATLNFMEAAKLKEKRDESNN